MLPFAELKIDMISGYNSNLHMAHDGDVSRSVMEIISCRTRP